MEKRLAHIERIISIDPIYNNKGELMNNQSATVLGWKCMIRPNEYKVGDLIVYVEVGSVMPDKPEYEFLRKYDFRVKTQKYFSQSYTSQGLILPLPTNNKDWIEGTDVTELLSISKYYTKEEQDEFDEEEKQSNKHWTKRYKITKWLWKYKWFRRYILPNKMKSSFPSWISKTDESRIQNLHQVLEQFKDKEVYITEKINYQSVTFTGKMVSNTLPIIGKFLPKKYQFIVCSRNQTTNDKTSLYWKIADKYNIEQILKENPTLTIQGEQGDTKVQGNKYGITEPAMWVFNIIDHEKNYHYNYLEMWGFCEKHKLNIVPLLPSNSKMIANHSGIPTKFAVEYRYKLSDLGSTVQELVEFSKGKSVINPNVEREGIVVRCIENGKKILSFKIINPDFELKYLS